MCFIVTVMEIREDAGHGREEVERMEDPNDLSTTTYYTLHVHMPSLYAQTPRVNTPDESRQHRIWS
jgi:hypothetical protein